MRRPPPIHLSARFVGGTLISGTVRQPATRLAEVSRLRKCTPSHDSRTTAHHLGQMVRRILRESYLCTIARRWCAVVRTMVTGRALRNRDTSAAA